VSVALAERGGREVVAFDNLKRRGSEINLARLRDAGVTFVHGDVRCLSDLDVVGEIDVLVECSAEPSVLAGIEEGTSFVVQTNLVGAYHCLELARRHDAQFVFLSTSRVYPLGPLNQLAYTEAETRFELEPEQPFRGASQRGISETFPMEGARTLYGSTKLGAELLVSEYAEAYGLRAVINRCGVIAGPWQMGGVSQGVFSHWVLSHYLGRQLSYIGYGGGGKQVRDLLHVRDLVDLVDDQLARADQWAGSTVNVGGGRECSLSLLEATEICRALTGNHLEIGSIAESRPGDVPLYLSDCARLAARSDWRPRRGPHQIMEDIFDWIHENERTVIPALG
jgi:CDP-paratose 2-epimerase